MLFLAGAFFTFLFGIPLALYRSGGYISVGDFFPFFSSSEIREDLLSIPLQAMNIFTVPWLSFTTPLDYFNMFILYVQNLIPVFIAIAIVPYAYPFKGTGKWYWNPSDGMWVLKFIFNKVSEKDVENAMSAINENPDNK